MADASDWITLATTPPASPAAFDELARALDKAKIEIQIEENPVRQCERDPAAWLRVHSPDLALAWNLARQFGVEM